VPVCRETGFRANVDCADVDTLFMPPNAGRSALCPYHKIIHLDSTGNFQVNESCSSPANMIHKSWFILPPVMEYYYKQHNHDYRSLPPFKEGCTTTETGRQMEMIYPEPNTRIYVPLEINGERGKTIFTATHRNRKAKIFWSIDDHFISTTENTHQIAISPSAGKHIITLTDDQGLSISRSFEIIEKETK